MLFLLIKVCLISNNGGVLGIAMTTAIVPELLIPGEGENLVRLKTKVAEPGLGIETEQTLAIETEPVTEILAEERNLAQNIQLDEERLQNHHE